MTYDLHNTQPGNNSTMPWNDNFGFKFKGVEMVGDAYSHIMLGYYYYYNKDKSMLELCI